MTGGALPPGPSAATIILVGGPMTVDDGSQLDSRQPIAGDPTSHSALASLSTSPLWWLTTSSLVSRLLDGAGDGSFALMIGNRTVVELRQDGSLRRSSLKSLLPGGTTSAHVLRTSFGEPLPDGYTPVETLRNWNGSAMGTVGFKLGDVGCRWRFVDGNEYYLAKAGRHIGAYVVLDTGETLTSGGEFGASRFEAFEQRRLFGANTTLIMPHTHRTETLVRGYLDWANSGRPPAEGYSPPPSAWDPTAPPDPINYTCPVPVRAQFAVTGLAKDGQWQDPSNLEAARTLLQARYDLNIGIWDLANNPILRRTLLTPSENSPAPVVATPIPEAAARRAETRVAARIAERTERDEALRRILQHARALKKAGWKESDLTHSFLELPLTPPYTRWPGSDPWPLLELRLAIDKRQTSVSAFTILYNQLDIEAYLRHRASMLEDIAAPEPCPLGKGPFQLLWKAKGGWADPVDWPSRLEALAHRTPPWIDALTEFRDACRAAHATMFP